MEHVKVSPPFRIIGAIQKYAWGKKGSSSRIAAFVNDWSSDDSLAEYWLGTHAKAPASVVLADGKMIPLPDLLGQDSCVGENEISQYHSVQSDSGKISKNELPFMLKVLSINAEYGLSIQSHPDLDLAGRLHVIDPINYPDASHKPEVGVALSPVKLLYGLKSLEDLREIFEREPELHCFIGSDIAKQLAGPEHGGSTASIIQRVFSEVMRAPITQVSDVVAAIRLRYQSVEYPPEDVSIMNRLARMYGDQDVGLVALFLMNIVTVSPGEAIFIGSGIPHAYLDGDLVECMACSDNVIRAGLTSKFKDVDALIDSLNYDVCGKPSLIKARAIKGSYPCFDLPVREFKLGVISSDNSDPQGITPIIDSSTGHVVVLCLGNSASIVSITSGAQLSLGDGGAAFLPKGSGNYRCAVDGGPLFVAASLGLGD